MEDSFSLYDAKKTKEKKKLPTTTPWRSGKEIKIDILQGAGVAL